jgi:hypothetical protein
MVFITQFMWCELTWVSKQSAIALDFTDGQNLRPDGQWIAVGALGPSLFMRDFAMSQLAWDVTSVLPIFVSHDSSAFLRVIRLIVFVTQLTAVLHAGSVVSCNNFRSLCLCFNQWSRPGRSLFMSECVNLLVDNLYAEAIETV